VVLQEEQENNCLYPQNKFVCYKNAAQSLALGQFRTCSSVNTELWNLECQSLQRSSWLRSNKCNLNMGGVQQVWWDKVGIEAAILLLYGNKTASDHRERGGGGLL
jgi:hypothetical protein